MKPVKKNPNRRISPEGNRSRKLITLAVVLIALIAALLLLERIKRVHDRTGKTVPDAEQRHPLPDRGGYAHTEMQPYSTAVSSRLPQRHGKPIKKGTVAIIVDDMGSSLTEAKRLIDINIPLTFAVIPGLARDREVARLAHERGYQVMIHTPMEPHGYPSQRLEANGLLVSQDDDELSRRFDSYRERVPHASGTNNHMGSRFTEDAGKMGVVLKRIREENLFFIDSRTSPHSKGLSIARSMGIPSAGRNVFLDNVQEPEAIRARLDELASLARKKGGAIGICHPHETTVKTLAAELPRMKREGITFVLAGDLVR